MQQAIPAGAHQRMSATFQQRKPVPGHQRPSSSERIQPLTKIIPDQHYPPSSYQDPQFSRQRASHAHSRTASSTVLPDMNNPQSQPQYPQQLPPQNTSYQPYMNNPNPARRSPSNATVSTTSTGNPQVNRKNSVASSNLQRSVSSRSGNSASSYVAMMRKQKATVWSERAQHEDPRVVAQQRAAKMRAAMEVAGSQSGGTRVSTSGGTSITGGVRSKIRHHGATKVQQYTPHAHPASGVPMRLSAREVDEDDYEDDNLNARAFHQRSSSGRSSVGSGGRLPSIYGPQHVAAGAGTGLSSESNTPPQTRGSVLDMAPPRIDVNPTSPEGSLAEQTPVPENFKGPTYTNQQPNSSANANGGGSSEGSERENSFGAVSGLPHRVRQIQEHSTADDLQRRGSVDERTMTMKGYGKLFVANPDVDD